VAVLMVIAAIIVSYLIGSIPTGYLVVKAIKKTDIRTVGSGNIGATNVKRVLGMKWFFGVLALDALKGLVPVLIFGAIGKAPYYPVIAGVSAILGHTFTCFLNFKGGKGVATGLGVFLGLAPFSVLTALVVFTALLFMYRYISLGSIAAAGRLPVLIFIYGEQGYLNLVQWVSVLAAAFIIYKHKDNIKRLLEGTENKFEFSGDKNKKEGKK